MRVFITALIALAALAVAAQAATSEPSNRHIARAALQQSLAPLLAAKIGERGLVDVNKCHARACRFRVRGTANCRGVIHIRKTKTDYALWVSRLYCRTAP